MIKILEKLESKYLNFKLGEEQKDAILQIFEFINNPGFNGFSFYGPAGTGKTSVTKIIIAYLEWKNIPYQLVCPTHKSKKILANTTNREVVTIHQLLALKPTIDIMELDMKDLQFNISTSDSVPRNGIIIVDECSMVNDLLYNTIIKSCTNKNCKVIFQGDSMQIKPPKQKTIAKTFQCKYSAQLTQIYRQTDQNCVRDVLDVLRTRPLRKFETTYSKDGNIFVYDEAVDLIEETIRLFKESIKDSNPNRIKLIAYTNRRVQAFNRYIRTQIFKQDVLPEYMIGDILFGYDNSECYKESIENSGDYQIKEAFKIEEYIDGLKVLGWWLTVYDFDRDCYKKLYVLSAENDAKIFETLGEKIESLRISAINASGKTRKLLWIEYYKLMGQFLTPVDINLGNRTIRNKSIDYGYAITAHKSQSSSFDNVAIDIRNILTCKDPVEIRQMQYVALSRTRENVYILN